MSIYLELGTPLKKPVGEEDVVPIDYSDWLGDEVIDYAQVTVEPGTSAVSIVDWQIAPDKKSLLVAYKVVARASRPVRILTTAKSSNRNRVAEKRAIVIQIA